MIGASQPVQLVYVIFVVFVILDNFTEQELADLVREMEILKQFDPHPHVIQLYGACTQEGRSTLAPIPPFFTIMPFKQFV